MHDLFDALEVSEAEAGLAELEPSGVRVTFVDSVGKRHVVARADPAFWVNVIRVAKFWIKFWTPINRRENSANSGHPSIELND